MARRTDPFVETLGIHVSRRTDAGMVSTAVMEQKHLNPYQIAHGGVAYTMGCVTAKWAAEDCQNREMEIYGVSSQYLAPLGLGTATCETRLLFADEDSCTYEALVRDQKDQLCFSQLVMLRPQRTERAVNTAFPRTIFPAAEQSPVNSATGLRLPLLAPGRFADLTQVYILDCDSDLTSVGVDILPETSDSYGSAHCGLVYTCCDTGVGIAARMRGHLAVTVSSAMKYFRPAQTGPIRVEARAVREGHTILYYQVIATDGTGAPVAAGQFCLHPKESLNGIVEDIEAQF